MPYVHDSAIVVRRRRKEKHRRGRSWVLDVRRGDGVVYDTFNLRVIRPHTTRMVYTPACVNRGARRSATEVHVPERSALRFQSLKSYRRANNVIVPVVAVAAAVFAWFAFGFRFSPPPRVRSCVCVCVGPPRCVWVRAMRFDIRAGWPDDIGVILY